MRVYGWVCRLCSVRVLTNRNISDTFFGFCVFKVPFTLLDGMRRNVGRRRVTRRKMDLSRASCPLLHTLVHSWRYVVDNLYFCTVF